LHHVQRMHMKPEEYARKGHIPSYKRTRNNLPSKHLKIVSPISNPQSPISSPPIPSHALSFSPCQHKKLSSRSQSPSNPQSSSNTSFIDLSNSQPSNIHSLNTKSNAHNASNPTPCPKVSRDRPGPHYSDYVAVPDACAILPPVHA
jgi:hypothetical protein